MSQYQVVVSQYGTVVTCRNCRFVVVDEENPSEREVEEACEEHTC